MKNLIFRKVKREVSISTMFYDLKNRLRLFSGKKESPTFPKNKKAAFL